MFVVVTITAPQVARRKLKHAGGLTPPLRDYQDLLLLMMLGGAARSPRPTIHFHNSRYMADAMSFGACSAMLSTSTVVTRAPSWMAI